MFKLHTIFQQISQEVKCDCQDCADCFIFRWKKDKSYFLSQRICIFPTSKEKKRATEVISVGCFGKCQSIKKVGRSTLRKRFVSDSLFLSPCPPEC